MMIYLLRLNLSEANIQAIIEQKYFAKWKT